MTTKRTGRLSIRLTPDFLDVCSDKAKERNQTLTEFVQISMALNLVRAVNEVEERKAQIINSVLNHG